MNFRGWLLVIRLEAGSILVIAMSCSATPTSKWISPDYYQSDYVNGAKASKDSTST